MVENPLVSVIIITYNSSKFVVETLESIKSQTYKNIELVVSDDYSTDDTVQVVDEWLQRNKEYFSKTKLVLAEKNEGISANCNKGVRSASGVWVKLLAGDDKLESFAIERYLDYVKHNEDAKFLCCKLKMFGDDEDYIKEFEAYYDKNFYPNMYLPHAKQFEQLLKILYIPGPGVFYSKELWNEVKGYEEKYKYCEEYPFYVKLLEKYKLHYISDALVLYRVYRGSVCRSQTKVPIVYEGSKQYFKDTRFPLLIKHGYVFFAIEKYFEYLECDIRYYKSNVFYKYFVKLLHLLYPYRIFSRIGQVIKGFSSK